MFRVEPTGRSRVRVRSAVGIATPTYLKERYGFLLFFVYLFIYLFIYFVFSPVKVGVAVALFIVV